MENMNVKVDDLMAEFKEKTVVNEELECFTRLYLVSMSYNLALHNSS